MAEGKIVKALSGFIMYSMKVALHNAVVVVYSEKIKLHHL